MIRIITVLVHIVCVFFVDFVYGQNINGRVFDSNFKAVRGASVYLNLTEKGTIVKVELTDSAGRFLFNNVKKGNYELVVSYLNQKTIYDKVVLLDKNEDLNLQDIILNNDLRLSEVVVQRNMPLVEQKIDRTIVNVDRLVNTGSGTALDVIEKSPGLRVGENGEISLKGRAGVTVYINDKPSNLSGSDLENYLRSLSSSSIKQLEIMTNPPAQYDAAGNAGVLNIKTKRNNSEGFNIGLNLNMTQHKYTSTINNINYSYQTEKYNFYGNLGYSNRNGFSDLTIERKYFNDDQTFKSFFNQNSDLRKMGYEFQKSIGFDYYLSPKTTIGVVLNGVYRKPKLKFANTSEFRNLESKIDSATHSNNSEKGKFLNGSINMYLKHEFNEKQNISFDADYLRFSSDNNQDFKNINYDSQNNVLSNENLLGYLKSDIEIRSLKSDYNHSFPNSLKFSAGGKLSFTSTDNIADYYNIESDTKVIDFDKTNSFKYKENIQALYFNLQKEYKKFNIQLGLRYERTELKGHQLGNLHKPDSSFSRSYGSFFPTIYLMYTIDTLSNHQLKLNYGRRIDRPYYQDLNPFLTPIDKFTYLAGNPFLLPSFSNKIELGYTFKKRSTATVSYSKATNQTSETIEINNGIYYSRPGNIGSTEILSFSIDGNYDLKKWLSFQFFTSIDYLKARGPFYGGYLDIDGVNAYLQALSIVKLPMNWSIQVDGNYQTDVVNAQFKYKRKWALNLGLAKKIGTRSNLRLAINDIFYTNINQGVIRNLNLAEASYKNMGDTRKVTVSYSIQFGGGNKKVREHIADGANEEKGRVKQ